MAVWLTWVSCVEAETFSPFGTSFHCLPSGAATKTFIFNRAALELSVCTGNVAATDLHAELARPVVVAHLSKSPRGWYLLLNEQENFLPVWQMRQVLLAMARACSINWL